MTDKDRILHDNEYGDMTPEQITEYEEKRKQYEITDQKRAILESKIKSGEAKILDINTALNPKGEI